MRNRIRRKLAVPSQNLDSFLDILTNTVGVLMFVSLFVTLIAVEADSIVKTPIVSKSTKEPRFFEIRDGKVTYLNDAKVQQEIETLIGNLPNCNRPDFSDEFDLTGSSEYVRRMSEYRSCISSRSNRLINFQTQTEYYNVKMTNASTFSMVYEPIATKEGENKDQIAAKKSEFNQVLAGLNPQQDYLAFIVRPDSFSAFRTAREQAWAQGFDVGWEPHKEDIPITFGSGGRAIGVQ
ncbi:hypothetical protein [Myxosarcina sp. GI1]|uniref:hypothetical protein n=1 Tax=Myxosarcina sp. GI1 TaxID=1541065 RepID=UPI000564CCE1|nr:hypothetical protein [Myxosarcina sp. GI1]